MSQAPSPNRVLQSMLDRLFSAIMTGPAMNCRPHNSRQRIDLLSLSNLRDTEPSLVLQTLLSERAAANITATLTAPASAREDARKRFGKSRKAAAAAQMPPAEAGNDAQEISGEESKEEQAQRKAWNDQQSVLSKLRVIADEAITYEQDTGVDVLHLGFPLVSIPPGVAGPDGSPSTRRILAPICFLPISIGIRSGSKAVVELSCSYDDIDRVQPNEALLAWIEQCTGKRPEISFIDEDGSQPWKEICTLVNAVAAALQVTPDPIFTSDQMPEALPLVATPRNDALGTAPSLICSAVLGLFPVSNQGLLRDTRDMAESAVLPEAVQPFVRREATQPAPKPQTLQAATATRLVSACDPCQAQSVEMARHCPVLVIHGPPGSGKSQTITNIIGDHLARGERVLFVCDKRTAVDVVANRLEALGLGSLCAVVHDPQKDQKSLYMAVRTQLDDLVEAKSKPTSLMHLAAADAELTTLYAELNQYHKGLMHHADGPDASLSALVGSWLALRTTPRAGEPAELPGVAQVTRAQLNESRVTLTELFERASSVDYPACIWRSAAAGSLDALLALPPGALQTSLEPVALAAGEADRLLPESPCEAPSQLPIAQTAQERTAIATQAGTVIATVPPAIRGHWASKPPAAWAPALAELKSGARAPEQIPAAPLDPAIIASLAAAKPTLTALQQDIAAIEQYLPTAAAWWGFLAFGKKSAAAKALAPLGLALNASNAAAALTHLKAWRTALLLNVTLTKLTGTDVPLRDPATTAAAHAQHMQVLELLTHCAANESLRACMPALLSGLNGQSASLLTSQAQHAQALAATHAAASRCPFIDPAWLQATLHRGFSAAAAESPMRALVDQAESLDECLRINAACTKLPAPLAAAARSLAAAGVAAPRALQQLERAVIHGEINRRLDAQPALRTLDGRRIDTVFARIRELEAAQQQHCRDAIVHQWTQRCRERLLAGTQSRLNSDGAAVKQRLFVKGAKAMRLRQVIAMGGRTPGGDPLFDLRPIWMASPETVAQIFPCEPLFDAVIFDEASQVRLEEALPVLARGKRIIIAGDPKQLPPTRFFESAAASDSQSDAADSDAELFEQVQADTEDLLSAALSLDVHQSYLDVHYRSQNADLIEFSNHNFYGSRLQAIPGHPRHRSQLPPLRLVNVPGVYEDRANEIEAQAVVTLVKELLSGKDAPSIGIGCFNIAQRDLITELLDEEADEDEAFGAKLAAARNRRSSKSFEGLFVKNLENVQGDERDHIIISTTYGPDPAGKFYRRFGPLAQPGGGRRLNVLVTRARQQVHILTSIPSAAYRALPPVPEGASPGGAWFLFAYLKFAEDLAQTYATADAADSERKSEELVHTRPTAARSPLAEAVAEYLADEHKHSSTVYWGNDGFCIDVATPSPDGGANAPVGVLTDFARFNLAGDAVKWDIFRSGILSQLGWDLRRIWTPTLLRDPGRTISTLVPGTPPPQ